MVQHTLSLMLSCGMYDYSGEFAFHVRIMGNKVPFTATHTHPSFLILEVLLDLLPKITELIP